MPLRKTISARAQVRGLLIRSDQATCTHVRFAISRFSVSIRLMGDAACSYTNRRIGIHQFHERLVLMPQCCRTLYIVVHILKSALQLKHMHLLTSRILSTAVIDHFPCSCLDYINHQQLLAHDDMISHQPRGLHPPIAPLGRPIPPLQECDRTRRDRRPATEFFSCAALPEHRLALVRPSALNPTSRYVPDGPLRAAASFFTHHQTLNFVNKPSLFIPPSIFLFPVSFSVLLLRPPNSSRNRHHDYLQGTPPPSPPTRRRPAPLLVLRVCPASRKCFAR